MNKTGKGNIRSLARVMRQIPMKSLPKMKSCVHVNQKERKAVVIVPRYLSKKMRSVPLSKNRSFIFNRKIKNKPLPAFAKNIKLKFCVFCVFLFMILDKRTIAIFFVSVFFMFSVSLLKYIAGQKTNGKKIMWKIYCSQHLQYLLLETWAEVKDWENEKDRKFILNSLCKRWQLYL